MNRTPSKLAQCTFDASNKLQYLSAHSSRAVRLLARAVNRIVQPLARRFGANHTVAARLYDHVMTMPAEHSIASILAWLPQYNRPLGLAAKAIANISARGSNLSVIDVGANIGETIAVIEQHSAGRFSYFCIEPDHDLAELCRLNYAAKPQVHVEECFVGEKEGAEVWLQDDGTANPSTRIVTDGHHNDKSNYGKLFRLDTVAGPFSESNGGLSLLKIDTEGYDFSILRSASNILNKYKPAVYFEWFPKLLINLNEDVWSGFEYLATFGYRYFVFFTSRGDYYCTISNPGRLFLRSLSSIALGDASMEYFDVLASTQEQVCSQVVEESIRILLDNKLTRR